MGTFNHLSPEGVVATLLVTIQAILAFIVLVGVQLRLKYVPFVGSGRPALAFFIMNVGIFLAIAANAFRVLLVTFNFAESVERCDLNKMNALGVSTASLASAIIYGRIFCKAEATLFMSKIASLNNRLPAHASRFRQASAMDLDSVDYYNVTSITMYYRNRAQEAVQYSSPEYANRMVVVILPVHLATSFILILVEPQLCAERWSIQMYYNFFVWVGVMCYGAHISARSIIIGHEDKYGVRAEWNLALFVSMLALIPYLIVYNESNSKPWFVFIQLETFSASLISASLGWWPFLRSFGMFMMPVRRKPILPTIPGFLQLRRSYLRFLEPNFELGSGHAGGSLYEAGRDKSVKHRHRSSIKHHGHLDDPEFAQGGAVVPFGGPRKSAARAMSRLEHAYELYSFLDDQHRKRATIFARGSRGPRAHSPGSDDDDEVDLGTGRARKVSDASHVSHASHASHASCFGAHRNFSWRKANIDFFDILLSPPRAFNLFSDHLRKEYNLENLLFLQAVARVRSLKQVHEVEVTESRSFSHSAQNYNSNSQSRSNHFAATSRSHRSGPSNPSKGSSPSRAAGSFFSAVERSISIRPKMGRTYNKVRPGDLSRVRDGSRGSKNSGSSGGSYRGNMAKVSEGTSNDRQDAGCAPAATGSAHAEQKGDCAYDEGAASIGGSRRSDADRDADRDAVAEPDADLDVGVDDEEVDVPDDVEEEVDVDVGTHMGVKEDEVGDGAAGEAKHQISTSSLHLAPCPLEGSHRSHGSLGSTSRHADGSTADGSTGLSKDGSTACGARPGALRPANGGGGGGGRAAARGRVHPHPANRRIAGGLERTLTASMEEDVTLIEVDVDEMSRELMKHVPRGDHYWRIDTHKNCFNGATLIKVAMERQLLPTLEEANQLARHLLSIGVLTTVTGNYGFQSDRLYRFTSDGTAMNEKCELPLKEAREVWNTYLKRGSYFEVNVSDGIREGCGIYFARGRSRHRMRVQVPVWAFDEAAKEIYRLVAKDSVRRFKESPAFRRFLEVLDADEPCAEP